MQKKSLQPTPPGHELEEIAEHANCTVPTVRNFLKGKPGKPRIAARVRAALLALGFDVTTVGMQPAQGEP